MKYLLFLLSILTFSASTSFAQSTDSIPLVDLDITPATSEQPISQQLIGYAIEVSSTALSEKKPVGRYSCNKIYSAEGYNLLSEYPCEIIIHSQQGPIVVRYKDVLPDINEQIQAFLKENQMQETLYYNNGRFRFTLDEEDISAENEPEETPKETPKTRRK